MPQEPDKKPRKSAQSSLGLSDLKSDVCILGNAETVKYANKMHAQWGRYPSFWAIWGDDGAATDLDALLATEHFYVFSCKEHCPWSVGLHNALEESRWKEYECEYFFTVRVTCSIY